MRRHTILQLQGYIALIMALAMLLPLGVSLYYGEHDTVPFAIAIAVTAGAGLVLQRGFRGPITSVSRRESFAIVTLGWVLASAFGSIPFVLAGTFPNLVDAYFETMSGFTTTGASVMVDIEVQPRGILLWRSLTQWLGGMGIIVLFVAVMPLLGVGAAQMFEYESPGPISERLTPRIRETAKALWTIYLALSGLQVLILLALGLSLYDAVLHMFSTLATGGYSSYNASIAAYPNPAVQYVFTFFMAAAGVNFGLYYWLWHRQGERLLIDRELRLYLTSLGVASALVLVDLIANAGVSLQDGLRLSLFQVASIHTTTGFATADFARWPAFSQAVLLVLMLIGGSAGSTGGGMKVIRLWALYKYAHRELFTSFEPRAVIPIKLGGRRISDRLIAEVLGFGVLYVSLLGGGTVFLAAFGIDLITAFSAVLACLSNVGPGLNLVGPTANYAFMPEAVKIVLAFLMLAGRLELWTVLVLLRPSFWTSK